MEFTQSSSPIKELPIDVVNRIAAGEVIVKPWNAIKELLENALDAHSTEVTVTIRNGGLDLIKVKDNGSGINQEDYPLVCQRFATSKLKSVSDLQSISTFGFRGEALASISCMSEVQVTSHTKNSPLAWTVNYKNCKPCDKPKASAGSFGTTITVENLFKEYPQRRAVFTRPSEQAVEIANILVKYAINFPHVKIAFVREERTTSAGGSFCSAGDGDQHAIIRKLMPSSLTKDLFDFEVSDEKLKFTAKAHPISSHTSTSIKAKAQKQKIFMIFINNRSVLSPKLKHAIDSAFSTSDANCPFFHISMQIDPSRIDVNVHPTKEIVCFLDEAKIIDCIQTKLFEVMVDFRQYGVFDTSNRIDDATTEKTQEKKMQMSIELYSKKSTPNQFPLSPTKATSSTGRKRKAIVDDLSTEFLDQRLNDKPAMKMSKIVKSGPKRGYVPSSETALNRAHSLVRVDALNRSMDEFINPDKSMEALFRESNLMPEEVSILDTIDQTTVSASNESEKENTFNESIPKFANQMKALEELRDESSPYLTHLVRNSVFVGFIDVEHLIFQCGNCIYMVEFNPILEEMFYQISLRLIQTPKVGNCWMISSSQFKNGIPLVSLLDAYFSLHPEAVLPNSDMFDTKEKAIDALVEVITKPENLRLLSGDFGLSVVVDEEFGYVFNLMWPLVKNYMPLFEKQLPKFAYDLACVKWDQLEIATKQIARAIARLYTPYEIANHGKKTARKQCKMIKNYLLVLWKMEFHVPERLNTSFRRLLSTLDAYKIFGRC